MNFHFSLNYPFNYHLTAKHVQASVSHVSKLFDCASTENTASSSASVTGSNVSSTLRQPTLIEIGKRLSKTKTEQLTNTIAKWIAQSCRPVAIIDDPGLEDAFKLASSDPYYKASFHRDGL